MATKPRTGRKPKSPKKIAVPSLVINELTPKHNKEFNQALGRYAEIVLRKQAGEPISDMYEVPVLRIAGRSAKRNAEVNKQFKRELNLALEKASAVAIAPIVVGIVAGIVGNIIGNVINDIITNECSD
jgi:hypothetical protein